MWCRRYHPAFRHQQQIIDMNTFLLLFHAPRFDDV
jgi:hypothetical protein